MLGKAQPFLCVSLWIKKERKKALASLVLPPCAQRAVAPERSWESLLLPRPLSGWWAGRGGQICAQGTVVPRQMGTSRVAPRSGQLQGSPKDQIQELGPLLSSEEGEGLLLGLNQPTLPQGKLE